MAKKRRHSDGHVYQCRRCSKWRGMPSVKELVFGRIFCCWCGGTCDPGDDELRRLDAIRSQADRHARRMAGF